MKRALALAIVMATAAPAFANGRFPASTSLAYKPGDDQTVALGLTFGLVLSNDDGAHWYWMCEQSIGYGGTFDPKYAIGPDGTLYATTFDGLRVSRDGGCTFETSTADQPLGPGNIANIWVDAIAVASDGSVWVGTAENGVVNAIYRSTDQARTFTEAGLDSTTIWWKSIQVSPSDPMTAYVSGYQVAPSTQVFVYKTSNGGTSWDPLPIDTIQLGTSPLVMVDAVDPANPAIVYARSVGANGPSGDRLYRSEDGGQTWTDVLDAGDTLHVAMRSTGELVAGTVKSDDMTHGCTYRSSNHGATFGSCDYGPQMACVKERGDGEMFACGANWDPDFFAVARSSDAQAWSKVFRFHEMSGPLHCAQGTVQYDMCELQQWPSIKEQFGVVGPVDAGVPDGEPVDGGKGCCDATSGGEEAAVVLMVVVGVGLLVIGRRRKKKKCCN